MQSEITKAEMVDFLASLSTQRAEKGDTWAAKQFAETSARLAELDARAEKAEALYEKAWAECHAWRTWNISITAKASHDAARKEAGL